MMQEIKRSIVLDKEATKYLISMVTGPGVKGEDSIEGLTSYQKRKLEKYIKAVFTDSWKRMREKNPICGKGE